MIARLMIVTLTPFVVIQLSYVILRIQQAKLATAERWWALGSFILCCLLFVGYSLYQVLDVTMQQRRLDKAKEALMWKRFIKTLSREVAEGAGAERWLLSYQLPHVMGGPANSLSRQKESGLSSARNIHRDSQDVPHGMTDAEISTESDEEERILPSHENSPGSTSHSAYDFAVPQRKFVIFFKATLYLLFGTGIVLIFADPIVKAISALGAAIQLSPFYISFVVTPAASNSSELFGTFAFAKKKTKKTISLVHSSLYGAVAMNNSISLGVFLAMIFFRQLKWNFSAETLVIAVVTISVGILAAWKVTIRTYHILWVSALYPLSILLIALLESPWIGWD